MSLFLFQKVWKTLLTSSITGFDLKSLKFFLYRFRIRSYVILVEQYCRHQRILARLFQNFAEIIIKRPKTQLLRNSHSYQNEDHQRRHQSIKWVLFSLSIPLGFIIPDVLFDYRKYWVIMANSLISLVKRNYHHCAR